MAALGREFDLFDDYVELQAAFPCDCGKLQMITFHNPFGRGSFERVPFDEATAGALELSPSPWPAMLHKRACRRRSFGAVGVRSVGTISKIRGET